MFCYSHGDFKKELENIPLLKLAKKVLELSNHVQTCDETVNDGTESNEQLIIAAEKLAMVVLRNKK
jgi:hypothetical protein